MAHPQITPSEHIRDLSSINDSVPVLLSSASAALAALTGDATPSHTNGNDDNGLSSSAAPSTTTDPSLQSSKQAFTTNAQTYFTTLQEIMARLRRQAYALEEAGIISAEAPVLSTSAAGQQQQQQMSGVGRGRGGGPGATTQQQSQDEAERLVNGGLGSLDVAYLNSRVGKAGLEKEGEVLEEARRILKEVIEGRDTEMGEDP